MSDSQKLISFVHVEVPVSLTALSADDQLPEPSWHGAVTSGSGPRGSSPTGRPKPFHTTDRCEIKYVSRHEHVMRRGFGEDREVRCVCQGKVMGTGHRDRGPAVWYLSLWTVVCLTRKWAIILLVHGLLRDSWFIYWLSLQIIIFCIWPPGSHCLCSNTLMWSVHRPFCNCSWVPGESHNWKWGA